MKHFSCTGMICILLILLAAPAAADYLMFGADEARTGTIPAGGPMTNATLWAVETAEYADGSPAVHDGKVFVPTWPDMNFTDNEPMGLVCYDAATGEELWTNELGGAAVGAVSGVAVSNGKVYLGGTDGKLYCVDEKTGATSWSSEKIDETGYFGLSSSPLVYNGNVYTISASDATLHAFTADGDEAWSFPIGGGAAYFVSPAATDGKVYCSNMTALFCIDPATQDEVWNVSVTDVFLSTPTVGGNAIFCAGAINTYAFDRENGDELWNVSLAGTSSSPAVDGANLYVGASDGLHCLNTTTGVERWAFSSAQIPVSPVVADGTVYFATNEETGTVYAVDAATGDEVWSYSLEAPGDGTFAAFYASSPAISDGVLYIGAENNHLYAFGEEAPGPESIFDGTASLTDTTFTFVPSNNASASYEVNRTTDLGALDAAADLGGFTFDASDAWYASYGSFTLESIDGIANEDWTKPGARSWSIFINNQSAPRGLGGNTLDDGDLLEFFYCPVNETTYAPLIDEATYMLTIGVTAPEMDVIFDGTIALTDTTFTFVPSNNASASYEVNRTTDLGALDAAADLGGFTFDASDTWYASYGSFTLESIDGIANEDWTKPGARSWSIFVNNQSAPRGLGGNTLDDGDLLEFFYCPVNETTYAPLIDEADAVVRIRASMSDATLSALKLTDGSRGGSVRADVTASAMNEGWYVVVVSGTDGNGESLAGAGTVHLTDGENVEVPVLVTVPLQAKTGTYTLHAGIYQLDDYPKHCLFTSEGVECTIT